MNAQLGVILLLMAFLCAVYALIAALVGAGKKHEALVESARNATIMTWPLLTLATLLLVAMLVRGDFSLKYVIQVSSRSMPVYLRVAALWGGQSGSLLFWSWLMSSFAAGAMLRNWSHERNLMPYVIGASMGTLAFFVMLVTFWENPFAACYLAPASASTLVSPATTCPRLMDGSLPVAALFGPSPALSELAGGMARLAERLPGLAGISLLGLVPPAPPLGSTLVRVADGRGLNPLLWHFGMVFHPPMLYLGFVGFVVPYAFAMAALVRGEVGDGWIRATRRWTLVAWLFLSMGLILGGRWAYDVLGWGGYWAWDPVENAALLPWLTGTAFLHSVMIQEKRGMLRRWNMLLIVLTYLLVILGAFLTRSGVLGSVHAFAQSAIGPLFFLFVAGATLISVDLLIRRWKVLAAEQRLDSLLSRETLFLLNNLVFLALSLTIAVGTYWPLVTELAAAFIPGVEKASVGAGYFNRATGPLWLALILLMGIAPLVAWKRSSLKKLGRAMLWPLGLTVLGLAAMVALGLRDPLALIGYGIALLAGLVTVLEFHRGAVARLRLHGESYPRALWTLFGRNRRRYGGYTIHLGVIIMAIGILASNLHQLETQREVSAGQTITLGDYVLEYETLESFRATDGRQVTRARTVVYHQGREVARLAPRLDTYPQGERMTIPATHVTLTGDDLYVILVLWEPLDLSSATLKIYYNPLVNWVWGGSLIFVVGTLIAAWPDFGTEQQRVSRPRPTASVLRDS